MNKAVCAILLGITLLMLAGSARAFSLPVENLTATSVTSDSITISWQNPPNAMPLYRFWSENLTDHFYTNSSDEGASAQGNYIPEGTSIYILDAPQNGTTPIHRFWLNDSRTDHFYSTDGAEKNLLLNDSNAHYEGIIGYVMMKESQNATPFFRLFKIYNETTNDQDHFYTASEQEKNDTIASLNYADEGITGYGYTKESRPTFSKVHIYLNGQDIANTSSEEYTLTGLDSNTEYKIEVYTEDENGEISKTETNQNLIIKKTELKQEPKETHKKRSNHRTIAGAELLSQEQEKVPEIKKIVVDNYVSPSETAPSLEKAESKVFTANAKILLALLISTAILMIILLVVLMLKR
jgi:hypothetical protein